MHSLAWPDFIFAQGCHIACSISAPCKKGVVLFTGLTGTGTTIVVGSIDL